jgi:hypothetical protein
MSESWVIQNYRTYYKSDHLHSINIKFDWKMRRAYDNEHTCVYIYTHTCVYICVCVRACVYACASMRIGVYLNVFVCVCVCKCAWLCVCVCVCVCLCVCAGNTKGGSITVLLTSCLTGLESAVWQLTIFCFNLQNRLIQTSKTGGQQYSDASPFSIP